MRDAHKARATQFDTWLRQYASALGRQRSLELVAACYGTNWDTLSARPGMEALGEGQASLRVQECAGRYGLTLERSEVLALFRNEAPVLTRLTGVIVADTSQEVSGGPMTEDPVDEAAWETLGITLNAEAFYSHSEWRWGELGEDLLGEDRWRRLCGLAEDLEGWLPCFVGATWQLEALAKSERPSSVREVLDAIFAPVAAPEFTLCYFAGLRAGPGYAELVSLHPERYESGVWVTAHTYADALNRAKRHVLRNHGLLK